MGCGFQEGLASIDAATDAPVTCESLTCDPHATCLTSGPPACVCGPGYSGNGMTCQDIDECAANHGGCPAACANEDGSFVCFVPATCADIEAQTPGAGAGGVTLY